MQLSKSLYLHVQLTVFSRLAHMLLRYANVRKSIRAIKIWLKISFVREAKYDTHSINTLHTSCSGAGERAKRKLGRDVILANKMDNFVLQRYLRLHVENQQENKNRKQEEKLVSPLLLTLLKAISFKMDSIACHVTWREVQVWGRQYRSTLTKVLAAC